MVCSSLMPLSDKIADTRDELQPIIFGQGFGE